MCNTYLCNHSMKVYSRFIHVYCCYSFVKRGNGTWSPHVSKLKKIKQSFLRNSTFLTYVTHVLRGVEFSTFAIIKSYAICFSYVIIFLPNSLINSCGRFISFSDTTFLVPLCPIGVSTFRPVDKLRIKLDAYIYLPVHLPRSPPFVSHFFMLLISNIAVTTPFDHCNNSIEFGITANKRLWQRRQIASVFFAEAAI